jgi:hypothetical protein
MDIALSPVDRLARTIEFAQIRPLLLSIGQVSPFLWSNWPDEEIQCEGLVFRRGLIGGGGWSSAGFAPRASEICRLALRRVETTFSMLTVSWIRLT